jgi:hypothetical protein
MNRDLEVGMLVTYPNANGYAFGIVDEIKTEGQLTSMVWVSSNGKKPHRMPYPHSMMILPSDWSEQDCLDWSKKAAEYNRRGYANE